MIAEEACDHNVGNYLGFYNREVGNTAGIQTPISRMRPSIDALGERVVLRFRV